MNMRLIKKNSYKLLKEKMVLIITKNRGEKKGEFLKPGEPYHMELCWCLTAFVLFDFFRPLHMFWYFAIKSLDI